MQLAPRLETRDEAIGRDAAEYARHYGVPEEQALAELRAQIESVALTDAIAREFSGRFVGMAIDHVPRFRMAVLLAGDLPIPQRTALLGGIDVPIVFHTGARTTYSEMV